MQKELNVKCVICKELIRVSIVGNEPITKEIKEYYSQPGFECMKCREDKKITSS